MWGRKEDQSSSVETLASASQVSAKPSDASPRPSAASPKPVGPAPATAGTGTSRIGQAINFKGEIHSAEDLLVDGAVDGSISIPKHTVVIGLESKVHATIEASSVLIRGQVEGNIKASDKVEIFETGRFKGDLIARRLEIHDGAVFVGSSAMHQAKPASPAPPKLSEPKAPAAPVSAPLPKKEVEAEPRPAVPPAKPAPPKPDPKPAVPQRSLTKP